MVQIQDVLRYILRPVERKFRGWEAGPGFKGKLGRWFRIGKAPTNVIEALAKCGNTLYQMLWMFSQRPWGPIYKRVLEMDMMPGKILFPFTRHRWILLFWIGNTFVKDMNHMNMTSKDPDYLLYYELKFNRKFNRNVLNYRTSAHYLEIQRIYMLEMMKKFVIMEKAAKESHDFNRLRALE